MVEGGKISEWNEATLKIIRLHELQRDINMFKIDPLKRTKDKFNYEWWFQCCVALRGEGYSKYSKKEKETVDKLQIVIEFYIKKFPSHQIVQQSDIGGSKSRYSIDQENFSNLKKLISKYEDTIKQYNDDHGLTTSNRESSGYF